MTTEITRILKGYKEFSEEPYLDSIKFLREYIEVEPSSEAFFELGKALFFNEDYDKSIEYLKKSDDARCDAYLGLNHYRKGEFEKAIRHFSEFLKENKNETILTYMMLSHEKCSDWQNAIACGERLLEINPDNFSIKVHLIDYHLSFKQYHESLNYIDELNREKCRYKRGLVLFHLKRYDEAINELKSLKTVEAYRLMSKSYDMLDKDGKAIRCLYKAYENDGNVEILFEIADYCFKKKYCKRAINTLNEILETDPNNERALEKLAEAYIENCKFDHAKICCEALLKINDKNIAAHIHLSMVYYNFDDREKSLEIAERGLAIDPKSADLWIAKAWIHYYTDFEEFISDYEHALKLDPTNIKNYKKLIWHCAFVDKQDYARRFYEKLLFYNPAFAESFEEVTRYADWKWNQ